jgi:hypothetical protein
MNTREPTKKLYTWELKDANRGYWNVSAEYRGTDVFSNVDVGDYYETIWDVQVEVLPCQPGYKIWFQMNTMYDEPIQIADIAREIHNHIMGFYDAALIWRK